MRLPPRPASLHLARRTGAARGPAATCTTALRRRSRPPPPAAGRTLSFVPSPAPRFVVLVVVESGRGVALPPLRLVHDAPTLRDLRRIVRHPHLIVKQLAARVPQELLELRRAFEQPARPGQRPQHGEQALGAVRSVHFFRVIAHVPAFADVCHHPPTAPSMIIPLPAPVVGLCVTQSALLHCGAD